MAARGSKKPSSIRGTTPTAGCSSSKAARNPAVIAGGTLIALLFVGALVHVLDNFDVGKVGAPALSGPVNDVQSVGHTLFTSYNLPLQIVGVLVLVATVGVVVLSKRELE